MKLEHHIAASGAARRQRGASLYVVIVMLATMGLMTLTAFYMSRNQYRLVGNIQYQEQAFNQTEAVVAQGENWLNVDSNAASVDFITYNADAQGLYPIGQIGTLGLNLKTMIWSNSNSIESGAGRYVVTQIARDMPLAGSTLVIGQALSTCNSVNLFQVTGRSNPVHGASRTIETTYGTAGC
jgi:Tfp pilus assembly protein PilX